MSMVKFWKKALKQKFISYSLNCLKLLTSLKTFSPDDQLDVNGSNINDLL